MAFKLALCSFVTLLLLSDAGARLCSRLATGEDAGKTTASAAHTPPVSAPRAAPSAPVAVATASEPRAPARDTHILWNAACWLVGIGLVATRGRSSELAPALD